MREHGKNERKGWRPASQSFSQNKWIPLDLCIFAGHGRHGFTGFYDYWLQVQNKKQAGLSELGFLRFIYKQAESFMVNDSSLWEKPFFQLRSLFHLTELQVNNALKTEIEQWEGTIYCT